MKQSVHDPGTNEQTFPFLHALFAPYQDSSLRIEIRTLWPKSVPAKYEYVDRQTGEIKPLTAQSAWYPLGGLVGAERYALHQDKEWDCYVGVLPRRGRRRFADSVDIAAWLWVEIDGKDAGQAGAQQLLDAAIAGGLPAPTIVVGSGGGIHAYWRLAEPVALEDQEAKVRFRQILRRLAYAVGGVEWERETLKPIHPTAPHADPLCCDVARILRLPGCRNHKPERQLAPVQLLSLVDTPPWSLGRWRAWLPPTPALPPRRASRSLQPGEKRTLPPWTIDLINSPLPLGTRHPAFLRIFGSARRCGWERTDLEDLGEDLIRRNGADRRHIAQMIDDTVRRIQPTFEGQR